MALQKQREAVVSNHICSCYGLSVSLNIHMLKPSTYCVGAGAFWRQLGLPEPTRAGQASMMGSVPSKRRPECVYALSLSLPATWEHRKEEASQEKDLPKNLRMLAL